MWSVNRGRRRNYCKRRREIAQRRRGWWRLERTSERTFEQTVLLIWTFFVYRCWIFFSMDHFRGKTSFSLKEFFLWIVVTCVNIISHFIKVRRTRISSPVIVFMKNKRRRWFCKTMRLSLNLVSENYKFLLWFPKEFE